MKAEDMFKHYKEMCRELSVIAIQLSQFTGVSKEDIIECMTFSHPDGDKVQTFDISNKTENIAIKVREIVRRENKDYYNYLYDRYVKLDKEIRFFEGCIRELGEKKSDIVFELLDGDLSWESIADQYQISRSSVANYRRRAIKKINEMYELRDQQEVAYVLS